MKPRFAPARTPARRARLDLLTVGEAFEDLIFPGLAALPRLGEEIRCDRMVRAVGGGVVITAVAAARAGLRVGVMSGLADEAVRLLTAERIAVANLRRRAEPHATSVGLSTPRDRCFVTFPGVNPRLERRLLDALPGAARARHVHLALTPARCRRWLPVVRALRERGITTSWDFGWNHELVRDPGFAPLLEAVDVLFVNEREAPLYAGARGVEDAARQLRGRVPVTIVKLGARGARWVSRDLDLSAAPPRVRAVDTTGAGDAFDGGFLAGLLRGRAPAECLRLGNRMGALSTRAVGGTAGLPPRALGGTP